MALTPQERNNLIKVGFVVAVVVLVAVFYPGLGINASRAAITTLDTQVADEQKKLDEMKTAAESLSALRDDYNRLRPEIEAQERRLPLTRNYDDLFHHLNMLGAKNGIKFDSMEGVQPAAGAGGAAARSQAQEDKGYESIPIQIKMHVDFHGLGRFVNDVENGERFMKVETLAVNNGEERLTSERDWSVQNVELLLTTFQFKESEKKTETPAGTTGAAGAKAPTTPAAKGKGK